jgi:homopolymeric O-antigen transport system permease protein
MYSGANFIEASISRLSWMAVRWHPVCDEVEVPRRRALPDIAQVASTVDRPLVVIDAAPSAWQMVAAGLRELWGYGDLLRTLAAHRIRVRYKQSALGLAWALVQPAAMTLVFVAVFSFVGAVDTGGVPYPLFAYAGLLPWTFFSAVAGTAAAGLVGQASLVTKVYFPREILPLSYIAAAMFDLLVGALALGALIVYYDVSLGPEALYAIPLLALLAGFTSAVALLISAIHVRFRDLGIAMPLLLQLWFFASPVVYPLSAVPGRYRFWYSLNPLAGLIDAFRSAVVLSHVPDVRAVAIAAAVVAVALPAAYAFFKRVDATMADRI